MLDQMLRNADREIKGRSFGRGCLIAAIIGVLALFSVLFLAIRLGLSPGPESVRAIPENFPEQFVLYRPERILEIYVYSASAKRGVASFALAPIRFILQAADQTLPASLEGVVSQTTGRETVSFGWRNLDTTPDDLVRFYAGAFKQAGLLSPYVRQLDDRTAIEMVATSTFINASLAIVDRADTPTVDAITLIVDYPAEEGGR